MIVMDRSTFNRLQKALTTPLVRGRTFNHIKDADNGFSETLTADLV